MELERKQADAPCPSSDPEPGFGCPLSPYRVIKEQVNKFVKEARDFTQKEALGIAAKDEAVSLTNLPKLYLHIDMDAFFAAVETLLDPSLQGIPMAVGGSAMLSTANYAARQYGVTSAMPGYIAKRLCPQLVIVNGKYERYKTFSAHVMHILHDYDANLRSFSVDEASLDIRDFVARRLASLSTESRSTLDLRQFLHGIVSEIRGRIEYETGLTCSAGLGYSRRLAKLCSNVNKPNGQYILAYELSKVQDWLSRQSIRRLQGVGKVTAQLLSEGYGIYTCQDVHDKRYVLAALFGEGHWQWLLASAMGLESPRITKGFHQEDHLDLANVDERKSISIDRTLDKSSSVLSELQDHLRRLSIKLEEQASLKGIKGMTLTLKLKSVDFHVKTKAKTFESFLTNSAECYLNAAIPLLHACLPCNVRLVGLRLSNLSFQNRSYSDASPVVAAASLDVLFNQPSRVESVELTTIRCPFCCLDVRGDSVRILLHEKECRLEHEVRHTSVKALAPVSLPQDQLPLNFKPTIKPGEMQWPSFLSDAFTSVLSSSQKSVKPPKIATLKDLWT